MAATETATRATQALDGLYRAHAREVYRYAYAALGNHADAEDVTQTTFVNALRALERGDRPRRPSSWLIAIAHNVVRQRFRTQRARPAEVELDHDIAVEAHGDDGPTLDELVRALQRIPHTQREALVMRELEGRTYAEIREVLELTPTALEMLLFRARRSLAEELESVVTCKRAELAIEQRHEGRLSRKERRRLLEHLRECPACVRLDASRKKRRRRRGALALFPLPFSLTFFRGTQGAAAATGAPAGGGGVVAAGAAVKALALAAAVTTVTAAGYVGYVGIVQPGGRGTAQEPAMSQPAVSQPPVGEEPARRPLAPVRRHAGSKKPRPVAQPPAIGARPAPTGQATSPAPGEPAVAPAPGSAAPATATAAAPASPPPTPQRRARPAPSPAAGAAAAGPEQQQPEPDVPGRAAVAAADQPEQSLTTPETEPAPAAPAENASAPAAATPAAPGPAAPAQQTETVAPDAAPVSSAPVSSTPVAATPVAPATGTPAPDTSQPAPRDGDRSGHGRRDGEHAGGRDGEPPGTPTRTRRGFGDGR